MEDVCKNRVSIQRFNSLAWSMENEFHVQEEYISERKNIKSDVFCHYNNNSDAQKSFTELSKFSSFNRVQNLTGE